MNLALITPTPAEAKELRREIEPNPHEDPKIISEGKLYGKSIIFSHCGVGKVNAAHTVTLILENYDIDFLILFGIAGAYAGSALKVGDVAVAERENYGEEGVLTNEGWKPMEVISPLLKSEKEYYNTFSIDRELSQLAVRTSRDMGFNATSGSFVTVSQCSGTRESGEILRKRFNGICENMEGAAVTHICTLYGLPMLEIRGISNIIEERNLNKWNIPLAVSNCNKVVSELVRHVI